MTQESVLVVCDAAVHSLSMSSREWKILHVRPFAEAQQFIHALASTLISLSPQGPPRSQR